MAAKKRTAKRRGNILPVRACIMEARSEALGAAATLEDALDALAAFDPRAHHLVITVRALRTIANAPLGTPGVNLRGVAAGALKQIGAPTRGE